MSTLPKHLLTAEEFAALPLGDMRSELIAGVLHTMPPTSWGHGKVAMRLGALVTHYTLMRHLGETSGAKTGFLISRDPDTVRAPDFSFIQHDRLPPPESDEQWGTVIPDLVAEVISPSDRPADIRRKAEMWVEVGVRLVWVVLPAQRVIEVYRPGQPVVTLGEADMLDGADVVPGFAAPVAQVFG